MARFALSDLSSKGRHHRLDLGLATASRALPLVHAVPWDLVGRSGPAGKKVDVEVVHPVADCRQIDPLGPECLEGRRTGRDDGPDGFCLRSLEAGEVWAVTSRCDEEMTEVGGTDNGGT